MENPNDPTVTAICDTCGKQQTAICSDLWIGFQWKRMTNEFGQGHVSTDPPSDYIYRCYRCQQDKNYVVYSRYSDGECPVDISGPFTLAEAESHLAASTAAAIANGYHDTYRFELAPLHTKRSNFKARCYSMDEFCFKSQLGTDNES